MRNPVARTTIDFVLARKLTEAPVRMRFDYASIAELISEVTRHHNKGGMPIPSKRNLGIGTRFTFELHAHGLRQTLDLSGEVSAVQLVSGGQYVLSVRYDTVGYNRCLETAMSQIHDAHRMEKRRKHPRLPVQLRAAEEKPGSPVYLIRDISRGGYGIEVDAAEMPPHVAIGVECQLEITAAVGTIKLAGQVVWLRKPAKSDVGKVRPAFGIAHTALDFATGQRLERFLSGRGLPQALGAARIILGPR